MCLATKRCKIWKLLLSKQRVTIYGDRLIAQTVGVVDWGFMVICSADGSQNLKIYLLTESKVEHQIRHVF